MGVTTVLALLLLTSLCLPQEKAAVPHQALRVLATRRLDVNTIVNVTALKHWYDEENSEAPWYKSLKVTVKERATSGWRPVTTFEDKTPSENSFCELRMIIGDFDKNGSKEIAVIRSYQFNSGGTPEYLQVLKFANHRLSLIGEVDGNQPFQLKHWGAKGHTQFLNSYEIGYYDISHADMPRWNDVYEVRNGKLVQVNAEFPAFYRKWARDLRKLLVDYPIEPDLWAHYGFAAAYARLGLSRRHEYLSVARDVEKSARRARGDEKHKLLAQAKELRKWAKNPGALPKAIKPFSEGSMCDPSPRMNPPKNLWK